MRKTAALKKPADAAAGAAFAAALPEFKKDEEYAGILLDADGCQSHHLILLPGEAESVTHAEAKKWAKEKGGELPTRKEQALLFANAAQHFKPRFYWSSEQLAEGPAYAWGALFNGGGQGYYHEGGKYRARAVRRVPI